MPLKDQIQSQILSNAKAMNCAKTGFTKSNYYTKSFINTSWATMCEYAAAYTLNEERTDDFFIPTNKISCLTRKQKKELQYDGYDLGFYGTKDDELIGLHMRPTYGADVKAQMKAKRYGSVNLEAYTMNGNSTKRCYNTWLWATSKVPYIIYVIEDEVIFVDRKDLIKYAQQHIEEAVENSFEAQNEDAAYAHTKKFNVKLPLDTLRSMARRIGTIPYPMLQVLSSKLDSIIKYHSSYTVENFAWLPSAIERAKTVETDSDSTK